MTATILHLPGFVADPARHETRTSTVIALDMSRNIVLIGGTWYAGEIKKSVFSLLNFHAPLKGIFPMHCSANIGAEGDTALFFGLSGTGKTTLSSDPSRRVRWDRRRRASVELSIRHRQYRGRLLRQDRASERQGRARKSSPRRKAFRHRA